MIEEASFSRSEEEVDDKDDDEEFKKELICGICYEKVQNRSMNKPCGHIFCQKCIVPWFINCVSSGKRPTCPLCRTIEIFWGK